MDVIFRLRQVDFMSQLDVQDLTVLAQICQTRRFVAGEEIIKQGDLTHSFCIIDEGYVHFRKTDVEGFEHPVGSKGPGEYFGMQMFSAQEPAETTAEALGQATVYIIGREAFDQLCKARPELLKHLPEVVAARRRLTHGFQWLTQGEIVANKYFRHPIALLRALRMPALLALFSVVFWFAVGWLHLQLGPWGAPGGAGIILLLALIWGLLSYFDWRDDMLVVTNKRIVQFERQVYATEMRNQIPINRIQSINITKTGMIQSALNVGTLEIQSAANRESNILFNLVQNPEAIRAIIQNQQFHLRARQQAEDRELFRRRVGKELRHYVLQQPMEETPSKPRPAARRSFFARFRHTWNEMFAYEVRSGDSVTWRKHWWGLAKHSRPWVVLTATLGVSLLLYVSLLRSAIPLVPFLAAFGVLALIDLGGLAYGWADWRNDVYQLTDRAVIDIERKPLGLKSSSKEALLVNVQDVRSERPGLLNAMLNFGDVEIRVAGGGEPMVFYDVPHPEDVSTEVFRRLEAFRLRQREREASLQGRNMVDTVVAYHRLLVQERHAAGQDASPEQATTSLEGGAPAQELSASETPPLPPPQTEPLSEFPPVQEGD